MGKKYIIEIEDGKEGIILCQKGIVTVGLHLENESELKPLGIQSAIPYTEPDLERVKKTAHDDGYSEGYQAGREDLNRVMSDIEQVRKEAYGEGFRDGQYAERNGLIANYAQEQEEIKVGDEVEAPEMKPFIVTGFGHGDDVDDVYCHGITTGEGVPVSVKKRFCIRSGRRFPDIAAVLTKMRGEQDE